MDEDKSFLHCCRSTTEVMNFILDSAEVGLCVTDFHTGEILLMNSAMGYYSGKIEIDEFIVESCRKHSGCLFCPYEEVLGENEKPCKPYVYERYLADSDTWLRITHQAAIWEDGRLAHVVTFLDIT